MKNNPKQNKADKKPQPVITATVVATPTQSRVSSNGELHKDGSILTDAEFLKILLKVKNGNFSQRFPTDQNGVRRTICETLNEIVDLNERMVFEFQKVGKSIGKQ